MPIKVSHQPDLNLVGAAAYSAGAGQRAERDLQRQQQERMQVRSLQAQQMNQERQIAARERQMMMGHQMDQAASRSRFGQQMALGQMQGAQRGALADQEHKNRLEYLSQQGEQGLAAQEAVGERQKALQELEYEQDLDLQHRKSITNWQPADQKEAHRLLAQKRAIMADENSTPEEKQAALEGFFNAPWADLQSRAVENANPSPDSPEAFAQRMVGSKKENEDGTYWTVKGDGSVELKLNPATEAANKQAAQERESDAKIQANFSASIDKFATTPRKKVGKDGNITEVLPTREEIKNHAMNLRMARQISMEMMGKEKQLAEAGEVPAEQEMVAEPHMQGASQEMVAEAETGQAPGMAMATVGDSFPPMVHKTLESLGVPTDAPVVSSRGQAAQLPPGTVFVTPDGKIVQVPEPELQITDFGG